jgi:hypothetical protein
MHALPWTWKAQSPKETDRLRIDKLTIYCGDKMLEPYGTGSDWLDKTTNYVFRGPINHNGDPNSRFCFGQSMQTLTLREQVHPSPEGASTAAILIWPQMFGVSPTTQKVRTFTIRQALQLKDRIWTGMRMDYMANYVVISPVLFHEMFHAAMSHAPSKQLLVNVAHAVSLIDDLAVLPYNGVHEVYPFDECKTKDFFINLWNPNSHMFFCLCKSIYLLFESKLSLSCSTFV